MAPTDRTKNNKFSRKDGNWKESKNMAAGVKKKKKWTPEQKVFEGSVKEGMTANSHMLKYSYSSMALDWIFAVRS